MVWSNFAGTRRDRPYGCSIKEVKWKRDPPMNTIPSKTERSVGRLTRRRFLAGTAARGGVALPRFRLGIGQGRRGGGQRSYRHRRARRWPAGQPNRGRPVPPAQRPDRCHCRSSAGATPLDPEPGKRGLRQSQRQSFLQKLATPITTSANCSPGPISTPSGAARPIIGTPFSTIACWSRAKISTARNR